MIRPPQLWIVALVALAATGCSTSRRYELLETQIRQQEDQLAEKDQELKAVRSELQIARQEAEALRTQLAQQGAAPLLPEHAQSLFGAQGVKFNATFTGGVNLDDTPGDDALSVVLMPVDVDGELVKLPGTIELELLDLSLPESQRQIGRWAFPVDEARTYWRRGFLSSGYVFQLPWQRAPVASELTLHGVLTTPDGRRFDTSSQVKVAVGARSAQQSPPALDEGPLPAVSRVSASNASALPGVSRAGLATPVPASTTSRSTPRTADRPGSARLQSKSARPRDDADRAATGTPINRLPPRPAADDPFGVDPEQPAATTPEPDAPQAADTSRPSVRTSDAFTEQSLPRYR